MLLVLMSLLVGSLKPGTWASRSVPKFLGPGEKEGPEAPHGQAFSPSESVHTQRIAFFPTWFRQTLFHKGWFFFPPYFL